MAEGSTPWYRHRVFWYAVVARIGLSVRCIPPSWRRYLYDNAAIASLVAHPEWTWVHVREAIVDWEWNAQDSGQADSIAVSLVHAWLGVSDTWQLEWLGALALAAVDFAIAHYLHRIFSRVPSNQDDESIMRHMPKAIKPEYKLPIALECLGTVAPLVYFANPFVILSTAVFGCSSNVKVLCLVMAMDRPRTWMANIALGSAMFLDVSWGVFAIALASAWDQVVLSFAVLQGWTYLCIGSVSIHGVPGTAVLPPPPSLSVLWYTHMEFFARFASYLQILIGYLPYIVILPLAIRLHRYPMVLVGTYWMILHTLCQPVSTLPDLVIGLLFLLLSPDSCVRMNPIITVGAIVGVGVPVTLYAVLHPLWLVPNAGEANFLYFQCLAYQIMVANVLLQFVSGSLQRDKALRVTAAHRDKSNGSSSGS